MNVNPILCLVLFIILCEILAHKNENRKKRKRHRPKLVHGDENHYKPIQRMDGDPLDKLQKQLGKYDHKGKIETYYDPYWQSGEWVFLRLTSLDGDTTLSTTTLIPGVTQKMFKKWPMSIYRDCDILCLNVYKDFFGPVCGQRYNTMLWKNEYKSFNNICELERENCKLPNKRPMWYPIHRESFCDELSPFKLFPTNASLILERKTSWSPYEYLRTTTTPLPSTLPPRPGKNSTTDPK